jgi:predicted ATPase
MSIKCPKCQTNIVEQILKSTTDVTILTTSREALNVGDEVTWRVPSLSLPQDGKELSAKELGFYEAIQSPSISFQ